MGKWVHRLSDVDLELKTANCENCGSVSITIKKGKPVCRVANNERRNKYRRNHPYTRPGGDGWHYRWAVKDTCSACGFVAEDLCQMDVDHIDGNHSNHDPENLQTLCANCHRLKTKRERNGMYKFHR